MCNKEELEECVYSKVREIKQKFYDCKTADEWQNIKEELVEVLAVAQDKMDSSFFTKYKEGVIASVKKMYDAKQAYFNKAKEKKTYQPKVTYLWREEEGKAFINLCNVIADYYKSKTK